MKKIRLNLIVPFLVAAITLSGCSTNTATDSKAPTSDAGSVTKIPAKSEIFTFLSEAAQLNNQAASKKSYTSDEMYAFYHSHFTRHYVDHYVLKGSYWEQKGNQWVLLEGGESPEGTYFQDQFGEKATMEVSSDHKEITVTNELGDGLYAPHKEIITLVHTDEGWKVDDVIWEALK